MTNFVSRFEKWGRRRCHFRPSWHYVSNNWCKTITKIIDGLKQISLYKSVLCKHFNLPLVICILTLAFCDCEVEFEVHCGAMFDFCSSKRSSNIELFWDSNCSSKSFWAWHSWTNISTALGSSGCLSGWQDKDFFLKLRHFGGFQLLDLIITELKSHMTC